MVSHHTSLVPQTPLAIGQCRPLKHRSMSGPTTKSGTLMELKCLLPTQIQPTCRTRPACRVSTCIRIRYRLAPLQFFPRINSILAVAHRQQPFGDGRRLATIRVPPLVTPSSRPQSAGGTAPKIKCRCSTLRRRSIFGFTMVHYRRAPTGPLHFTRRDARHATVTVTSATERA